MTGGSDRSLVRNLVRDARRHRLALAGLAALHLLASPVALLTPLPLKIVVDSLIGTEPPPAFLRALVGRRPSEATLLAVVGGLVLTVAFVRHLQAGTASVLGTWIGERLVLDLRTRLFAHAQRLSLAHHDSLGTGDALYRIQYDASCAPAVLVDGLIPMAGAALTLGGMLWVTARLDPWLAALALLVAPPLFIVLRAYRRRARQGWRTTRKLESEAFAVPQEALGALRVVRAFGAEEREAARFAARAGEGLGARIRVVLSEAAFGLLAGVVTAGGTAVVLVVGVRHVRQGVLTLGDLLLVMGYVAQLYDPVRTMSRRVVSLQSGLSGLERAYALLGEPTDVPEEPGALSLGRAEGRVTLRGVGFAYEPGQEILKKVSLDVLPGQSVGLSGRTGVGKSTLAALLHRFLDPHQGEVLLDGVDLRRYRLADLRRQFAVVLQEPVLFSSSLAENIAYGRPDASPQEIVAAARAAGAHDFIAGLPDGYDTRVGERGMRLSGGERQRIGLARAFLRDAPILILDEPTSAVDPDTEQHILEAVAKLKRGRTTFVIAHRPGALADCDLRVRLERGRVTEVRAGSPAATAAAHPAGRAWVEAGGRPPSAVVTLKEQGGGGVYRLEGATPGGRTVVAKRDHPDRLAPERFLYEATLPGLAVPHPGYLGSFEESEEMAWLFIEDVGDARFDPAQASHRSAASRWLAALHLAGEAAAVLDLPDRGPAHYREHLRSLRSRATDHQEDPRLGAAGRRLLRRLLFHCDTLEENWDRIEAACVGLPRTVVHGDFAPKNVAVRHRGGSVEVLPFDWELGGWGVPAPDLTLVDLDVYGRCVSRTWPSWTGRRAKETRALGVLFRAVAECDWAATFLPYDPVERSLPRLIVSETRLAEAAGDLFSLAS